MYTQIILQTDGNKYLIFQFVIQKRNWRLASLDCVTSRIIEKTTLSKLNNWQELTNNLKLRNKTCLLYWIEKTRRSKDSMVCIRPGKNVYFPASKSEFPSSFIKFPSRMAYFPYLFLYFFSQNPKFLCKKLPDLPIFSMPGVCLGCLNCSWCINTDVKNPNCSKDKTTLIFTYNMWKIVIPVFLFCYEFENEL